ncbi:hypothetical protein HY251_18420 [bacterium]|nr:hypothetical protein [bacterium]
MAALAALVYAGTLRGGILQYDDAYFILYPEAVRAPSVRAVLATLVEPVWGSYHPLHILSYTLDACVAGAFGIERAVAFHFMNVVYHAICAALVVRAARRFGVRESGALAAGLLFAVHPSHVESVAWLSGRKDVLSGALVLAALLAATRGERSWKGRALALAIFLLALGAKTTAAVLAPFLFLEAWLSRRLDAREVLALAPFAAVAGAWLLIELAAQRDVGGVQPLREGSVLAQLRVVGWALAWYPVRFLHPSPLTPRPELGVTDVRSFSDLLESPTGDVRAALVLLGALAVFVPSVRRERRAALLIGWFFLALAPVSGIVPLPSAVQDRYLFLPSIAAACLAGDVLARGLLDRGGARAACGAVILGLAVGVASGETVRYARAWRTDGDLWRETLRIQPTNPLAHWGLARFLSDAGEHDLAAREAELISLESGLGPATPHLKAIIAERRGLREQARAHYESAWKHEKAAPQIGAALVRLAFADGDLAGAATWLLEMRKRHPTSPWTRYWDGRLARVRGDLGGAESGYRDALGLSPASRGSLPRGEEQTLAWLGLAEAERVRGAFDAASGSLDRAEAEGARPHDVLFERGALALGRGDGPTAVRLLDAALVLEPADRNALHRRALALAASRRLDDAASALLALLEKDADADVAWDLARVESRRGQDEKARSALARAVALRPALAESARKDPLLARFAPP